MDAYIVMNCRLLCIVSVARRRSQRCALTHPNNEQRRLLGDSGALSRRSGNRRSELWSVERSLGPATVKLQAFGR
jgi:hypothetical protein